MKRFHTNSRGRRSVTTWAAIALVQFLISGSAQAQLGGAGPILLETDRNVAVGELSRMLPSAGVHSHVRYLGGLRWRTTRTMSLFALTQQGISTRYWDTDARDWTEWEHLGNPSGAPLRRVSNSGDSAGFDFGLPLLDRWDGGSPDWIAYQAIAKPSSGSLPSYETAVMQVDSPDGTLDYIGRRPGVTTASGPLIPSGWNYFNPQAGFSSQVSGANRYRRHMFGTGQPRNFASNGRWNNDPSLPLIEMRQEAKSGTPTWHDHGAPGEHTGVTVGAGSTTSVIHDYLNVEDPLDHEEQKYVFVATDPQIEGDNGINGPEIAYLRGDGSNFAWASLGSPGRRVFGAPVATTYYTDAPYKGGKGRIVVFAVAENRNGDYELSTHWHNGDAWDTGWQNHGSPPELDGGKFKMTSAVVWYNGNSNEISNLRISAFGYSEPSDRRTGGLVEFHWNGGSWGFRPVRYAPDGHGLRTDHSAVIDEGTRDRVVAFVRTYEGRIYEDVQHFEQGQRLYQVWNDLSTEPIVFRKSGPGLGFGN